MMRFLTFLLASMPWVVMAQDLPPVVTLLQPTNGQVLSGSYQFRATAVDNDGTPTKYVAYWRAGPPPTQMGQTKTTPNYPRLVDTTTLSNGTYTVWAKATDTAGLAAISTRISVIVSNFVSTPGLAQQATSASGGESWFVTTDASGNVLIAGDYTTSIDFGTGPIASFGMTDCFIAKYSSSGSLIWFRTFGGVANDGARSITVDSSGNVIVCGYFAKTVDFGGIIATAPDTLNFGLADMFVAKYAAGSQGSPGAIIWLRTFGSVSSDRGSGAFLDSSDNILMAGQLNSANVDFGSGFILTATSPALAVCKMDSAGVTTWARLWGNPGTITPQCLSITDGTNVVCAGKYTGAANLGGNALPVPANSASFVAKYSGVDGSHVWSRGFGDSTSDVANGITSDPTTGNIVVTGAYTAPTDFGGGVVAAGAGGVYMVGYAASDGSYLWALRYGTGGSGTSDYGGGVKVDGSGNLALTGFKGSFWGFPTATFGGGAFVISYAISGSSTPSMRWYSQPATGNQGASWGTGAAFSPVSQRLFTTGRLQGTVNFGNGVSATNVVGTGAYVAQYTN